MPGKYEMKSYTVSTNAEIPQDDPDFDPKNPKKTRKVALPTAEVPEFAVDNDGFQAATEYYAAKGGVAYVMGRFNAQIATDARNAIRSEFTKTPGDEYFKSQAWMSVSTDASALEAVRAHAADSAWVDANIIQPKIEQLKAEYLAKKGAQAKPVVETTDDKEGE